MLSEQRPSELEAVVAELRMELANRDERLIDKQDVISDLRTHFGELARSAQDLRLLIGALQVELRDARDQRDEALASRHRLAGELEQARREAETRNEAATLREARLTEDCKKLGAYADDRDIALRQASEDLDAERSAHRATAAAAKAFETEHRTLITAMEWKLTHATASFDAQLAAERQRREEIERRFLDQTRVLIETTRREYAQTTRLIDIVQSSRVWRIKRFLNRLRLRAAFF